MNTSTLNGRRVNEKPANPWGLAGFAIVSLWYQRFTELKCFGLIPRV